MSRRDKVQSLIQLLADEIFHFSKENEPHVKDGWVPTTTIKNKLELNLVCVPKGKSSTDQKGGFLRQLQEFSKIKIVSHTKRSVPIPSAKRNRG